MAQVVKRRYDNSRRLAQVRATRLKVIEAAKQLFIEHGYPATTIEAVADAADVALPTLYRLFGSKRAVLKAVLDTSFGGDDEPIAFGDRPEQQQALAELDLISLVRSFSRICRLFMERSSEMLHVLATAAQVDPEIADLQNELRRQRHTGQSRIVATIAARNALDPELDLSDAEDMVYAALSPEVHRIFTVERGWTADQYERWLTRVLSSLLRPDLARRRKPRPHRVDP
jgi:AcrR family transcriptional regulator